MTPTNREALMPVLAQLRETYDSLGDLDAGICVLHLDAAIAALESHLQRDGVGRYEPAQPQHAPVS